MRSAFERDREEGCLSDYLLDHWAAGELDAAAVSRVQAHVAECGACAAKLAEVQEAQRRFRVDAPDLAPVRPRRRPIAWAMGISALAACVLAVLIVPRMLDQRAEQAKGAPRLGLYVKHGELVRRGSDGERVVGGDALRFTYSCDAPCYLAILSVDPERHVSIYFPSGTRAAEVLPGHDEALSQSTVLDSTTGTELILGLFCTHAIDLEPIRSALAREPERMPAPESCTVDILGLQKSAP
jgi:hypothetical protein